MWPFKAKEPRRFRVLYVGYPTRPSLSQWSIPLAYDDAMARYVAFDGYEVVEVVARKPEKPGG